MRASMVVYAGLIAIFAGSIWLIRPRASGRTDGLAAGLLIAIGVVVFGASLAWPARDTTVASEESRLDHFVPRYQFNEVHSIHVEAPRERAYQAIRQVTADEIFLFRTLTWIRRAGRPGEESILNPSHRDPILGVALRTSFRKLAEDPGREIVVGTVVMAPRNWKPPRDFDPETFHRMKEPGFAVAAMNFTVQDAGTNASVITTETRVYATDPTSRQTFARYWRVIYPGSAFIRLMWLRAIRNRSLSSASE